MKLYAAVPGEVVEGWHSELKPRPPGEKPSHHYHDVEEWLTVVSGEMTFFTLADTPFKVDVGQALHIPRGEVHRAEVGSQGVEYQMFMPIPVPGLPNSLNRKELAALEDNLEFPKWENGPRKSGKELFKSALSKKLVFCRVSGKCEGRKEFLAGLSGSGSRSSSGSIQVLNKSENGGLLISTIVEVTEADGVNSYVNVRFLDKEEGQLRCRLWVNYPHLVPTKAMA